MEALAAAYGERDEMDEEVISALERSHLDAASASIGTRRTVSCRGAWAREVTGKRPFLLKTCHFILVPVTQHILKKRKNHPFGQA